MEMKQSENTKNGSSQTQIPRQEENWMGQYSTIGCKSLWNNQQKESQSYV